MRTEQSKRKKLSRRRLSVTSVPRKLKQDPTIEPNPMVAAGGERSWLEKGNAEVTGPVSECLHHALVCTRVERALAS